jgi:hypothetical protein
MTFRNKDQLACSYGRQCREYLLVRIYIKLEEDGDGEPSCLGKRVYQNSEVENRGINS